MSGFVPNNPPFFYICNKCGNHFHTSKKFKTILVFIKGPKCTRCGSRDTKENIFIMK